MANSEEDFGPNEGLEEEYRLGVSMDVGGPEFIPKEEGASDRLLGSFESAGEDGILFPEQRAMDAGRIRGRIVGYCVDWGKGWESVRPDPIGEERRLPETMRNQGRPEEEIEARIEDLKRRGYAVSGKSAHGWQCSSDRCAGCWEPSGWREEVASWLRQVPVLFDLKVRAARVMAYREGAATVYDVVPIAGARYKKGQVKEILVWEGLPTLSEVGWFWG
ncbi:MAG: hypothetical protein ACREDR_25890, partial [Blastocatellia bacterium]